jgi:hypothetical protein
MSHLVPPIRNRTIPETLRCIEEAHAFLTQEGNRHLLALVGQVAGTVPSAVWGQTLERKSVRIPQTGRPELMTSSPAEQPLAEIVNQCASLERVSDLLNWAAVEFPTAEVGVCHPTTSGGQRKNVPLAEREQDLVLRDRETVDTGGRSQLRLGPSLRLQMVRVLR